MSRTALLLGAVVALDSLAFALVLPLLPIVLADEGTSAWLVALIFAAFSVCQIVAAPVLGRWADRFGRRRVLIASQVGTLVGFAILAMADGTPGWILLSRVVDGFTAGNLAVVLAILCDLYAEAERTAAFAQLNAFGAAGAVLGLAGAAWLATSSLALLGWCAAGAALATVLLGLVTPLPPRGPALTQISVPAAWQRLPRLRLPLAGVVCTQILMTAVSATGALVLHTVGDLSARGSLSALVSGLVLGAGAQGLLGGRLERVLGGAGLLRTSWVILLVGLAVLSLLPALGGPVPWWAATLMLAWLVFGALLALAGNTSALSAASDLGAGATMGLSSSAGAIGQLIGPAVAIAALGAGFVWFIVFVAAVAAAGLLTVAEGELSHAGL